MAYCVKEIDNTQGKYRLWPNGVVNYTIDPRAFPSGTDSYNSICEAIAHWEKATVLRFAEGEAKNYIIFTLKKYLPEPKEGPDIIGTSNRIGMKIGDGPQYVYFDEDPAGYNGLIIHEIGHAVGMFHEHQRNDRDDYVTVYPKNVIPQYYEDNFPIEPDQDDDSRYDYGSIMHYGECAFSINGDPTIVPIGNHEIGQRVGLSIEDVRGTQLAYDGVVLSRSVVGGDGGTPFNDSRKIQDHCLVNSITLRGDCRLDAISMDWNDGQSTHHGGGGGSPTDTLLIRDGDYITAVRVATAYRHSLRIGYLEIETSHGKKIFTGSYQGSQITEFVPPTEQQKIVGFYGRSGDEIDALGVIFADIDP